MPLAVGCSLDRPLTAPARVSARFWGFVSAACLLSRAEVASAAPAREGAAWLEAHLPPLLVRSGPLGLDYYQWLLIPLALAASWLAGAVLGRVTRAVLKPIVRGTSTDADDLVLERLGGPLTLAWAAVVALVLVPLIGFEGPVLDMARKGLRAVLLIAFFWSLLRGVDIAFARAATSEWAQSRGTARSLLPLLSRIGKLTIIALSAVAMLAELGYPVASLVAGLGIGGLALALAAQKTVENLFGAFSLGVDQPFAVGDFVLIEDFVGTVEKIGLRSTRIRTLDRTLITLPNGRLAEMRLESFTARDRMRLACTVRLAYGTTTSQLKEVLAGLERVLRAHPKIWPDAVVVRFKELGVSSLDIEIMAWFETPNWGEFQLIRQEVLIQFMEVVEQAGTRFALPARDVHMVGERDAAESGNRSTRRLQG
ncbi:MAG TPA: mechanosensitive ion channel family protein [Polyangiaceae bacterium]|nr:mechanosensitive ion channel family protein [Polyangiaceae bacterium]